MTRTHVFRESIQDARWLWLLLVLTGGLFLNSCGPSGRVQKRKPTDEVLTGVPDAKMRQRWKQAEDEGKLPSIDAIPKPKQAVTVRRPTVVEEPPIRRRRPVIPPQTVADAQLFSIKPIARYDGTFQVVSHKPGVLVGRLPQLKEQIELYYKLPYGDRIAMPRRAKLQLNFRDEVVDGALQRRIILYTDEGTTPFVHITEGSQQPYRRTIDKLKLIIEQQRGNGNPPVKVTYAGSTVILNQGERQKIGEGSKAVHVYLLRSIARSPNKAMLLGGQPFYVNLILYRTQ